MTPQPTTDEQAIRDDEARRLVDFIYDACPVWPDACTRAELLRLYREWLATESEVGS